MIDRRKLFGATAALTSVISTMLGTKSAGAKLAPQSTFKGDYEPRGTNERLERVPQLDLESYDDMLTGLRIWSAKANRPARARFDSLLEKGGVNPKVDLSLEEIFLHVDKDPLLGSTARLRTSGQQLMWKALQTHFHENADTYFDELEAADIMGPGKLELNPDINIPEYTKHEIHIQPGGYVGDPFAGYLYHYGTNNFYRSANYQDEIHRNLAKQMPIPKDGRVLRILDTGCGCGQLTVALKERFPKAEVWGVDIGAPMVRYAHMRDTDLGVGANFRQALAEETKFPDAYFDIVTSYILHHEVKANKTKEIITESFRVLRPGGVYFPLDFETGNVARKRRRDNYGKFGGWRDHRWNEEVWRPDYSSVDFNGEMREVGFEVKDEGPPGWRHSHNVLGTKPA
ncbi:MAG: class I SAM-dependent methyltransferase [Rhodospirillaceae bacterium]